MAYLDVSPEAMDYSLYYEGAGFVPTAWTTVKSDAIVGELPAGEYYIGDIASVMNTYIYNEIWGKHYLYTYGVYKSSNDTYFAINHTDDAYYLKGNDGKYCISKSGLFGIMSASLRDANTETTQNPSTGFLCNFTSPVKFIMRSGEFMFSSKDKNYTFTYY
jgi:hypothetical protein